MLTTGRRFGPYEIHSLLGEGGMGEVYLDLSHIVLFDRFCVEQPRASTASLQW